MASPRKSIDVLQSTKADALKVLAEHFPPGTSAWAFFDALVCHSLREFKAGNIEILGQRTRKRASEHTSVPRSRPEPKLATADANGETAPTSS